MKRISAFLILLAALVLVTGPATAGTETEYKVRKGDSLWRIAHRTWSTGKLWPKIAEANGISDPRKLRIGQVLVIPELKEVIQIVNHNTSPYGARAVKGDPKVLKGIEDSYYPSDVKAALKIYVSENHPSPYILVKGEWMECVSDKLGVYCSATGYEFAWSRIGALRADAWTVQIGDKKYQIFVIEICGNFSSRITEAPPIEVPTPEEPAPTPPTPSEPGPPVKEVPIPKKSELKLPPVAKPKLKLSLPESCPPDHEPIIGAGIWGNGIADGAWYYGEYLAWLKASCDSEYSYGVGFYLNGEWGKSQISDYSWWGFGAGPQIGVKRYWFYTDKFGLDRPQQWTLKARFLWETLDGKNPSSGYANKQSDLKVGVYAEYIRQMSEKWLGTLTGEAWYNFDRHLNTTWKGDTPSDRTQISLGAFAQYKIDNDWQVRFGGGPFYQGWDEEIGLHLRLEGRYKEIVMFGPYANLFPYKTAAYEGVSLLRLQTLGAFVRVEFGPIIRDWDQARRAKRIQHFKRDVSVEGNKELTLIEEEPKEPLPPADIAGTDKVSVQESNGEDATISSDFDQVEFDKVTEHATVDCQGEPDCKVQALACSYCN